LNNHSLRDPTWLAYFEKDPQKASSPIKAAIENNNMDKLAYILERKEQYPKLYAFITQMQGADLTEIVSKTPPPVQKQ